MRELLSHELSHVSGGETYFPCPPTRSKGNNGFGNGGDDGVPGNSGKTGGGKAEDLIR